MASYIAQHEEALKRRHYIRHARVSTYFFDFTYRKMKERYLDKFGDDFCLVISHSDTHDDAYVMPFRAVAPLFVPEHVDDRGRWVGNVKNGIIHLYPGNRCMSVTA